MPDRIASPAVPASPPPRVVENRQPASGAEPVREYVGDLAGELARMARDVGDDALARTLEAAADLAMRPVARPIALAPSLKRRA